MTAWLWILGALLWTAIVATAWISIARRANPAPPDDQMTR